MENFCMENFSLAQQTERQPHDKDKNLRITDKGRY